MYDKHDTCCNDDQATYAVDDGQVKIQWNNLSIFVFDFYEVEKLCWLLRH